MGYILIGADIVPQEPNYELFIRAQVQTLFGKELCELFEHADYRIFNLETPLTDSISPLKKHGPVLCAPEQTVNGFKAMGVNLVTMANNHCLDQGGEGLKRTIEVLESCGICHVGAGNNLQEAEKPFIINAMGKTIGIYACAEHEFSIAGTDSVGANPFDPLYSPDHVAELKKICDYVIVLYHGGKEYYCYPAPYLQKRCRRLVEKGADLVLCQHSHCVGCREEYLSGTILYGQGDFLFTHKNNNRWNTGLIVKIDDSFRIEYLPIQKGSNIVRLAAGRTAAEIMEPFYERSGYCDDAGYISDEYNKFASEKIVNYLAAFRGKESFTYKVLNRLSKNHLREWDAKRKYKAFQRKALVNYIECEAHRDLILQALKRNGEKGVYNVPEHMR